MPVLPNVRHERFCQALFEGKSATEAYTLAGYHPHQGNSSRLRWFEMVQNRLAELQNGAAKKSHVTVQSLLDELEYARQRADNLDQLGPVVKAISEKAKIAGLLVNRVEVSEANTITLDDENTSEDVAIRIAKEAGVNLTPRDLDAFMGVIRGWHASMQEFLASCKTKQVNAVSAGEIEHKRLFGPGNARAR